MNTKILLLFTLFHLIFPKSYAQTQVRDYFQGEGFRYAEVSASVVDVQSMKPVYAFQEQKRMTPASVLKLLTTASALITYGDEYRFGTPLRFTGKVENNTLNGDLIIEGKGDPTIDSRYFKRADSFVGYIASSLRSKGIHKITGNIILNNSLYGTEVCAPKWSWDDMGNYYAAGIWGLNFKDNLYELTLKSGEKGQTPQIVSVVPDVPNMTFSMQLKAASNTKDSAYIYGAPFQSQRFVYGSIPANRSSFTIKGDMYDPNVVLISELKKQFKISGISVDGSWRVEYEQQPKGNQLAPPYSSPTLREIVKIVNYQSNNLFADGLLRLVAQKGGSGFHLFDQGVSRELALWDSKGLSKGGMLIFDGSGLSPMNRVTTDYLSRMLALSMKEQQIAESFYNSLPIAGKEGTVKSLFSDGSMGNRLRLKSGSMGGVLSYAGFLDKGGKRYAIAIIVNHFDASHSVVRSRIEKWIRVFEAGL